MPESPLPGAVTGQRRTDAREAEAGRVSSQPALAGPAEIGEEHPSKLTGATRATRLGIIREKQDKIKALLLSIVR